MDFVTKNGINVDDVADGALLLVALLHELDCLSGDQTQANDVRLHGAVELQSVFRVEQEALGDDASIVNQQVDPTANVFDPLEGCGEEGEKRESSHAKILSLSRLDQATLTGSDLILVANVTL